MPVPVSDDELRERVQTLLKPGESILWVGQPDPKQFWSEAAATFVFGFIPLSVGLVFLALAVSTAKGPAEAILPLFVGLYFCVTGIYLLLFPWLAPRILRETTYALTDRRALIFKGVRWSPTGMMPSLDEEWYMFGPESLRKRSRKRRYGRRVDLVFGEEIRKTPKGHTVVEIGFFGLPNPEQVNELLEQRFPRPKVDQA
jgi:hypothetical protein